MIKLSPVYQNGMVLQGGKAIRICGNAENETAVLISIQGQSCRGIVQPDGRWEVQLQPLDYSLEEELVISGDKEQHCFTDVAVGEVWLAGGQSNMEFALRFDSEWPEIGTGLSPWNIRFFDLPEIACSEALTQQDYSRYGCWRKNDGPENLAYFSAVGYYFAQKIAAETGHVVGIVGCNWGGTPACTWADPQKIAETSADIWLKEYAQAMEGRTEQQLMSDYLTNPMQSDRSDLIGRPMDIKLLTGIGPGEQKQLMAQMPPIPADPQLESRMPPNYIHAPGRLFKSMVQQIAPYPVCGIIWYQGESDSLHPEVYDASMVAVINSWRELWKEQLPFYQVQLPFFGKWLGCDGSAFPILRCMQKKVAKDLPEVYMTATMDCGMLWDIHPKNKRPVGERLGLLALVHTYHQTIMDAGSPDVESVRIEKGRAVLEMSFARAGLELCAQQWPAEKILELWVEGCMLPDFKVRIADNRIIVEHLEIQPGRTIRVRFAQAGYCPVGIVNHSGFSVQPFDVLYEDGQMTCL